MIVSTCMLIGVLITTAHLISRFNTYRHKPEANRVHLGLSPTRHPQTYTSIGKIKYYMHIRSYEYY